jgi:hypothetical protein
MHVVVLVAKDEATLTELAHRLNLACLPHQPMRESDGDFAGQLLSIGIEPTRKEVARRHVSSLPLLR